MSVTTLTNMVLVFLESHLIMHKMKKLSDECSKQHKQWKTHLQAWEIQFKTKSYHFN